MKSRIAERRILCAALVVVLLAGSTRAWESDLHFGLTKWLAMKAGFREAEAQQIALGAEWPDLGRYYPAPRAVLESGCLTRDTPTATFVQKHHFPSYAAVPGTASSRAVLPGSIDNGANWWVRHEVSSVLSDAPPMFALHSLGMSLHPLEDSWSHQGEPDIPPLCEKDLAWSHPEARGGWRKHHADLTYLHETDTVETAGTVYEYLLGFRKSHPGFGDRPPAGWAQLEPEVRKFAAARTKEAKREWFRAQTHVPFANLNFLNGISLPEGKPSPGPGPAPGPAELLPAGLSVAVTAPQESETACAEEFVRQFLSRWLIEQDIRGAAALTDLDRVAAGLAADDNKDLQGAVRPQASEWVATVLGMWLIQDHGSVNAAGHGRPERGFADLRGLVEDRSRAARVQPRALEDAVRSPDGSAPFVLIPMRRNPADDPRLRRYAVMLRFRHTPRDVLYLVVEGSERKWRIVGIDWMTL